MLEVPSIETFVEDWYDRYLVGGHYLVWCHNPTLGGTVFWGRPEGREVAELARLYALDQTRCGERFDTISDAGRLEGVAPDVFMQFLPVIRATFNGHQRMWRRHALVVPPGVLGAMVAGAFPLAGVSHAWRVFVDRRAAFEWLERSDACEAEREVEAIVGALDQLPRSIRELRVMLAECFATATLEDVASQLHMSPRSLQRELSAAGTTFRHEVDAARFRVASELVRHTDLKLEAVARQVGLSSLTKLNDVFRRVAQVTPRELRMQPAL